MARFLLVDMLFFLTGVHLGKPVFRLQREPLQHASLIIYARMYKLTPFPGCLARIDGFETN